MNNDNQITALRRLLCTVTFGATLVILTGCDLEVGPAYPGGVYLDYPPAAFIATTEPWYFEGRATYWYGNRWYYRNGGGWGYYNREPGALYHRRMLGPQGQYGYEPSGPRGRGWSGGRGGGRWGGHR
jgi:hypothetical protein